MKLYLVRHGQTDWNLKRKFQGQSDIPLNENGRRLAIKTGEGMRQIPFDLALTSPLCRAKQTAELILKGREVPIYEEPRLKEISFGEAEGESLLLPDGTKNPSFFGFFDEPEQYQPPKNGESFQELIARTAELFQELASDSGLADKTILMTTHGAALRAFLFPLRGLPLSSFWAGGVNHNCSASIVSVQDGRAVIEAEGVLFLETLGGEETEH